MEKYASNMKFLNYVVDSIEFRNNTKFEESEVSIDFDVNEDFDIDGNDLFVFLRVEIFKDAIKHNYPFEMTLNVVGYFKVSDSEVDKYKKNAVAIMYPYIRSLVTTFTASANVNPLILPTINVNKLIEMKNKE